MADIKTEKISSVNRDEYLIILFARVENNNRSEALDFQIK